MPKTWKQYPDEYYPQGEKREGIPLRKYDLILSVMNTIEDLQFFYDNFKSFLKTLEIRYPKKNKSFLPLLVSMKDLKKNIYTVIKITPQQIENIKKELRTKN